MAVSGVEAWSENQIPFNEKESDMEFNQSREPWNKGKLIGQKPPLTPKDTRTTGQKPSSEKSLYSRH